MPPRRFRQGIGWAAVTRFAIVATQNSFRSKSNEDAMGANHSGERRKRRMKRSKNNALTQAKAEARSTKTRKKKA
jgi:hypothetical protein